jgi:hypothetical protein
MTDCTICAEKTRKNLIKPCNYCKDAACVNCWKKYLVESPYTNCMFCSMEFKEIDIKCVLTIAKFKEVIEAIHLQQYKIWLRKPCKEYDFDTIKTLKRKPVLLTEVNRHLTKGDPIFERLDSQTKEKFLEELDWFHSLRKNARNLSLNGGKVNYTLNLNRGEKESKYVPFVPVNCSVPLCNGFLEESRCITCSIFTCQKCDKPIFTETHNCDKKDVETKKYLDSNSKNCPNCKAVIVYTSGCSAMFCPNCQTFFNWETLKIFKRVVHNPEYSRYLEYNKIKSQEIVTGNLAIDVNICKEKPYGLYVSRAAHLQYIQENIDNCIEDTTYALAEMHIIQHLWPDKFKRLYTSYFNEWKELDIAHTHLTTLSNAIQKYCESTRQLLTEAYDATKNVSAMETEMKLGSKYNEYLKVYKTMPKSIQNRFE